MDYNNLKVFFKFHKPTDIPKGKKMVGGVHGELMIFFTANM